MHDAMMLRDDSASRPKGLAPYSVTAPRSRRRLPTLTGCALCIIALVMIGSQALTQHDYHVLHDTALSQVEDSAERHQDNPGNVAASDVDFEALAEQNPDVVAWVEVENTDISLPVMKAPSAVHDFYLAHDFWGRPSASGVPFLDHRCSPDATHRLVYGHHLTLGGQFSQLQKGYQQSRFEGLGDCVWHEPHVEPLRLTPLCALHVNEWCPDIQQFSFKDTQELRKWLEALYAQASSRTKEGKEYINKADTVVTLVTCSSDFSHQPWRTLVMFVAESNSDSAHASGSSP